MMGGKRRRKRTERNALSLMAERDSSVHPLAYADALPGEVVASAIEHAPAPATSGRLTSVDDKQEQVENSLQELFSLLADVDVGDDGDGEVSHDSPLTVTGEKRALSTPTSSASDSPATEPPATTRKMKKRRCHEVLRMRETAVELERQLNTLKCRQEMAFQYGGAGSGMRKWQAKKEMQATARARLENAKLKEKVGVQTEFINSLQESLTKRQCSIEALQQIVVPRDRDDITTARPRTAKESEIYRLLIKNIYTRACELDEVFRINALADINVHSTSTQQETTINESTTLLNEKEALCIDLLDGYIIPFDFKAGAQVLWTHVLSKELEMPGDSTQTEIIVTTDDVIVTKQTANSNYMIQDHELTTEYSISKRVCDTNCVSFLWESITESKGALASSHGTPPIEMVQKGCVKVKHVATANGSSAASLQAFVRLSPSLIGADSAEKNESVEEGVERAHIHQQFDVRVLTATIVSSYRQHAESILRFLENTLIDDLLNVAKPSQRC